MSPAPNPMLLLSESERPLDEVKVPGFGSDVMGIDIEEMGSDAGSTSQDHFQVSYSVRDRIRRMRMSHAEIGVLTSLRLKIADWWSSVFRTDSKLDHRKTETNIRFADQEIELIRGEKYATANGSSGHNNNERGGVKGEAEETVTFDPTKDYLNLGEEDQMEIVGYEKSTFKTLVTWTFIFLTVGLLRLVFHWWPELMLYATHRPTSISKAETILVIEHYKQKYKRYYVKSVFILTSDLFNTRNLFPSSLGNFEHGKSEGSDSWNQQLQSTLRSIPAPKLVIPNSDGTISETSTIRVFSCKKLKYIWNEERGTFSKVPGFDHAITSNLHAAKGLSTFEQCQRRLIYGNNEIVVEVKSIIKLLFLEVLNPFYVFQIFSVTLWMSDEYYYFATAIIIMSVFGITSTIIQTRQNQKKLRTTVQSADIVTVLRGNGVFEPIPTEYLVPGDLIAIPPHGCTMQCDAALLAGSCIVNESMLTGESVPVTKSALPNRNDIHYDTKEHARHTLFCGTHVMQTRYYGNEKVLAVVLRTGFLTSKGSLVRSIMYPPPVDYKFENDSYKFVAALACCAGVGFVFSVFMKIRFGESVRNIIVDSLDLITIVVPPALPAAMTVGRFYAQRRLQKRDVYCISPRAINVSGSIDCVCFDKTGTLTEEGLDLWGVVPLEQTLGSKGSGTRKPHFAEPIRDVAALSSGSLMVGMAACHSLTRIDGDLIGDPLDLKMFEWVGWTLEEPGVADSEKFDILAPTVVRPKREVNDNIPEGNKQAETEVGIVRQFPFSSSLQRMSVITRTLGDSEYELYCKGSPEMISTLALPQTIPKNFGSILEYYTQEGYRVIAVGHKRLPKLNYAKVQRVVREELETELTFLGLIVMENRLKPETTGVMAVLNNAAIRTVMVTGDNLLTAISVARECDMLGTTDKVIVLRLDNDGGSEGKDKIPKIQYTVANKVNAKGMSSSGTESSLMHSPQMSILNGSNGSPGSMGKSMLSSIEVEAAVTKNRYHFALTGHVFAIIRTHYPELLSKILVRGTVFARMSPEQKQQLVEHLQSLGYFVGMCGDGSNDCGALKAAHAGISLSDTESSVAAPFTSLQPNITCVPHLIREGRGALVTSFGIFKYMAVYSLTQFVSVMFLYTIQSNLTDIQFLYIDLFLISVFAFFFGNIGPSQGPLVKTPPSASLVSPPPIVSIILHMVSIIAFQAFAFDFVTRQSWFTPYEHKLDDEDWADQWEFVGYENYALFTITCFQYIIMAIVFSRGKPHRKSIIHNRRLITSLIILTAFTIYLVTYPYFPFKEIADAFMLKLLPPEIFRWVMVAIGCSQLIVAMFIEYFVVDFILTKKIGKYIQSRRREKSKKEYIRIEYDLSRRSNWPPISNTPSVDSVYINEQNGGTKNRQEVNGEQNGAFNIVIPNSPENGQVQVNESYGWKPFSSLRRPRQPNPNNRTRTTSSNS